MELCRAETFGPVAAVYRCSSVDEMVARANDSEYGLNASVWTRDTRRGARVAARLQAGTVNVNEAYAAAWASAGPRAGSSSRAWAAVTARQGIVKYTEAQTVAVQRLLAIDTPPFLTHAQYAAAMPHALRAARARLSSSDLRGDERRRPAGRAGRPGYSAELVPAVRVAGAQGVGLACEPTASTPSMPHSVPRSKGHTMSGYSSASSLYTQLRTSTTTVPVAPSSSDHVVAGSRPSRRPRRAAPARPASAHVVAGDLGRRLVAERAAQREGRAAAALRARASVSMRRSRLRESRS